MPDLRMALGFIETQGLPAAMTAADAAAKAANVRIVGRELTRGEGRVTVKVAGDVGAVRASLNAAKAASEKVLAVRGVLVIPRPASGLGDALVWNEATLGAPEWRAEVFPPESGPDPEPGSPEPRSSDPVFPEPALITSPVGDDEKAGRSGPRAEDPDVGPPLSELGCPDGEIPEDDSEEPDGNSMPITPQEEIPSADEHAVHPPDASFRRRKRRHS
jgi:hypothetical protein